jgi:hypothetical protein
MRRCVTYFEKDRAKEAPAEAILAHVNGALTSAERFSEPEMDAVLKELEHQNKVPSVINLLSFTHKTHSAFAVAIGYVS